MLGFTGGGVKVPAEKATFEIKPGSEDISRGRLGGQAFQTERAVETLRWRGPCLWRWLCRGLEQGGEGQGGDEAGESAWRWGGPGGHRVQGLAGTMETGFWSESCELLQGSVQRSDDSCAYSPAATWRQACGAGSGGGGTSQEATAVT